MIEIHEPERYYDMNKEYILQKLDENRDTIKDLGVRKLGLFGSYARGDEKQTSDMDFLVEFEKKTFDNYMDLKLFLERLFDCKVDLVIADAVKPRLRKPIFEETIYAQGL
ncbi:MAG: nucleotidyltransferase family protein [Desulfomonilaceae bacterium]